MNIIHRRDIASSPTSDTRRQKLIDDYERGPKRKHGNIPL